MNEVYVQTHTLYTGSHSTYMYVTVVRMQLVHKHDYMVMYCTPVTHDMYTVYNMDLTSSESEVILFPRLLRSTSNAWEHNIVGIYTPNGFRTYQMVPHTKWFLTLNGSTH